VRLLLSFLLLLVLVLVVVLLVLLVFQSELVDQLIHPLKVND